MPDTDSVVLVKSFPYRGAPEEWSNKYHLEGTTPADDTAWAALLDAIAATEKTCYDASVTIVRGYGYVAGSPVANYVRDYSVSPLTPIAGTLSRPSNWAAPGDAAAMLRWATPGRANGKVIYLRKYFHGAISNGLGTGDTLYTVQKSAITAHGLKMIDGTLPGGMKVCGPQGADASSPFASPWITTRTLKRRGKRPPTTP